jgi:hypothetical protein
MCECKDCGFWSPCELGRSCPNDECQACRKQREAESEQEDNLKNLPLAG